MILIYITKYKTDTKWRKLRGKKKNFTVSLFIIFSSSAVLTSFKIKEHLSNVNFHSLLLFERKIISVSIFVVHSLIVHLLSAMILLFFENYNIFLCLLVMLFKVFFAIIVEDYKPFSFHLEWKNFSFLSSHSSGWQQWKQQKKKLE